VVSVYVKGLFLGCLLIVASIGALWFLDQQRVNVLENELRELSWYSDDSRLFLEYAERLEGRNSTMACQLLKKRLGQQVEITDDLGQRIEDYRNANVFNTEYHSLKRTYLYRSLEVWLNLAKYREDCGANVNHVFYFYSENDPDQLLCPDCGLQEAALNKLGKDCPNTWVFALPINSYIDIVNIIKAEHGIESPPSLVVNGEIVHEGFTDLETLKNDVQCGPNPFEE
jgi:hypothetical protein